ncbi:hypothetical protein A2U01_0052145, partial [Trifolium medium]|nr:hypothetical protein [Trifolium medium]
MSNWLKPELSYEPIREGPISVEDRKILMQHECYKGVNDYINQIKLS